MELVEDVDVFPLSRSERKSLVSRFSPKGCSVVRPSRRTHEVQCVLWGKVGIPEVQLFVCSSGNVTFIIKI